MSKCFSSFYLDRTFINIYFLGMDITGTTPLEMNVGQQKYVVAYTLKGSEKQPDILNAQKSSSDTIDSVQKMGSPAAIRPDALFSTSSSSSSKHAKSNEQHSTPPSHQSTLKYNDNSNKSYMTLNHTIGGNYNAQPPPYSHATPAMMNDYETPLNYTVNYHPASGTSNASTSYRKISPEYNNLNNLFNGTSGAMEAVNSHLKNELLENSGNFLEFERAVLDNRLGGVVNNGSEQYEFMNPNGSNVNSERYAGNEFANEGMDYKNLANQIANTISNINSTLNRSRNRNHILTENLPGPESCV